MLQQRYIQFIDNRIANLSVPFIAEVLFTHWKPTFNSQALVLSDAIMLLHALPIETKVKTSDNCPFQIYVKTNSHELVHSKRSRKPRQFPFLNGWQFILYSKQDFPQKLHAIGRFIAILEQKSLFVQSPVLGLRYNLRFGSLSINIINRSEHDEIHFFFSVHKNMRN